MANVTTNLGLPLDTNGKVEFEQAITKSLGILASNLGLTLPVRTEGMQALRDSYRSAMKQVATTLGIPIATDAIDAGMVGFRQTYAAHMSLLDTAAILSGYDVIVLGGQSNMVGRNGPIDDTLDATDSRIFMYGFDALSVVTAANPLDHQDETANTVGMGLTFAKQYLATIPASRKVLLVPVAKGGSGFNTGFWRAGGGGDAPAIARTNAAMLQGSGTNRLVAILWHQGEADQAFTQAQYATDLDTLIARWRSSMTGATATTPFICGGTLVGGTQTAAGVSAALVDTPNRVAYSAFTSASDLAGGGDNLHFTAAAQRDFGGRYFTSYGSAKTNTLTPTVPSAITNLASSAASPTSVTLIWSAPAANRSAITDYIVEYKLSSSGTWNVFNDGTSASTGATVTGLTNASAYDFRVKAVNGVGQGAYSNVASATPSAGAASPESAALRHWLFGSDNTSMADMKANETMTAVSTAPTFNSGYMTTAGQGKGTRSQTTDTATMTMIVVARIPTAAGIICGNFSAVSGDGGVGIFAPSSGNIAMNARPTSDNPVNSSALATGTWRFLAMSVSNGISRVDYIGDATTPTVKTNPTVATTFTKSPANTLLGVGDAYYNGASFAGPADVAEFILFNTALTKTDLDAVYARSVSRLSARGIMLA